MYSPPPVSWGYRNCPWLWPWLVTIVPVAPDVGDIHDQRAEHMEYRGSLCHAATMIDSCWIVKLFNLSQSQSWYHLDHTSTSHKSILSQSSWAEWLVSPPSSWSPLQSSLLKRTSWNLHQTQDCSLEMWQQVRLSDTNQLEMSNLLLLQICCLWMWPWPPMGLPSLWEDPSWDWPSTSLPLRSDK